MGKCCAVSVEPGYFVSGYSQLAKTTPQTLKYFMSINICKCQVAIPAANCYAAWTIVINVLNKILKAHKNWQLVWQIDILRKSNEINSTQILLQFFLEKILILIFILHRKMMYLFDNVFFTIL
jgi:hypothetical protein